MKKLITEIKLTIILKMCQPINNKIIIKILVLLLIIMQNPNKMHKFLKPKELDYNH
jgi:hypothetical protein